MKTLGIDYGKAKIGLALGVGSFAEPLKVVRIQNLDDAVQKVLQVLQVEQVDKVVVGISEGEMGEETKKFAEALHSSLSALPLELYDETLSSQDAQRMSKEAGLHQKKRHQMEDAYAAAIMLQNYLDSQK